jgi:hypothetical protein
MRQTGRVDQSVTMPNSFRQESDTQRAEAVAALEARAVELAAKQADDWAVSFFSGESYGDAESPRPEMFARAARVAVALCDTRDFTASNLSRVTFRPYPNKYEGAWRIEVSFNRGGPCAGSEWYVSAEKLWEAWELERCP